jgi:hemoglobin/transferrin/lactoferrin receptor protein
MRLLTLLLFFASSSAFGQKVTVLDVDTRQPIVGVALYNEDKSKSALTDFDGVADISAFAKAEEIIFSEVAHKEARYTKAQIAIYRNQVFLKQLENQLNEIVLSASKFAQSSRDVPQKIVSINSETIAFVNAQTSADLLESSGQVFVQKSQLGGGSPLIRGFATNRLLITLDGIRFNTAIFRGGNVQNVISIDPFGIERTEVILGPGSVVYGSDAIGGVMNFYTKNPQLSGQTPRPISGNALVRYSSANQEKTAHLDLNYGKNKWAFITSASFSDYDDQRLGANGPDDYLRSRFVERIDGVDTVVENDDPLVQVGSGFSSYSFMQKARFVPNAIWDFSLNLIFSTTSEYDRYDRLIRLDNEGNFRDAEWFFGPQTWFLASFQANKEGNGDWYDRAKATVAYQRNEESRNVRGFGETLLFETDEQVDGISAALDFTKDLKSAKNKLFYGVEYVFNHVGSIGQQTDVVTGAREETASRYPDGSSWQSLAAYASSQLKLTSKTSLTGGLRYNHIFISENFEGNNRFFDFPFEDRSSQDFGNVTGSLGLTFKPAPIIGFNLNFSTAFRAPNIDDTGKIFDSEPGSVVVPNTDLRAEYALNYEAGFNLNFENRVKFQTNVFYTRLDNALVRRDFTLNGLSEIEFQGELSNVQAIQNAGNADIWGIELGLEVNFTKELQLTSQLNVTDGRQNEEDGTFSPVRHVSPLFGNTHLTFTRGKLRLDAFMEYNGQFTFDELAPSQQNNSHLFAQDENGNPFSPRWHTINLAGQYDLTKNWVLNAALENISDIGYRTYSSGIAAPGRNLILSAKYQF